MTTLSPAAQLSTLAVFRKRSFRLLWTAQLISVAGSALSSLAAAILVYRMTGSALSVGLVLLVAALPSPLVGLIAGVFVDRLNRKHVMIAADLLRFVLIGAIPFVLPFGVVWLYVIVLIAGAVGQFFDPAHASVLPEVVSEEELAAANSFMAISGTGSWAIGFAAAGLIASQLAIEWAFYIDALSFLVSAACILGVRLAPLVVEDTTNATTVLRDLRAAAGFLAQSPSLRSMLLISVPISICIGLTNALLLPFALRALHATEFQYSVLEGLTSVGFVVGSLLMARLADRLHEGQWVALGYIGMALALVMFALSTSVPLAITLLMVTGLLNALTAIGRQLVIQRNTSNEVRGRVYSAFFVVRDVTAAFGLAAAGLADLYDVQVLFIAGSVVLLAAGALLFVMPGLRQSIAEWRQAMRMLRGVQTAPGLGLGRAASAADFDRLVGRFHVLAGLSAEDRRHVLAQSRVYEVPVGTLMMRQGEIGDAAYFVLDGRAVAGTDAHGAYRALSLLRPGDFFGEIAALTGAPRTATVMAQEPTTVFVVPAETLRRMMRNPLVNGVFLERIAERLACVSKIDLLGGMGDDRQAMHGGGAANPYMTMLVHTQASPYATALIREGAADLHATTILQGQVA
jgi:MFS family permease